jgi:hypothetical protein
VKGSGNVTAALIAVATLGVAVGTAMLVGDEPDPATVEAQSSISTGSGDTAAAAPTAGEPTAEQTAAAAREARLAEPVGHHGEYAVQYDDLPPATQEQLDIAQAIIEKYPTVADAEAAGWRAATVNLKGIAAHFLRNGAVGFTQFDDTFDINEPEALLFDGLEPDDPIVGISYLVSGPEAPEGYEGKWDVWHRHDAVCFANGLVTAEVGGHPDSKIAITEEDCKAQNGFMFPISNLSMIHVWMDPDNPSSSGVFSHDHPALT